MSSPAIALALGTLLAVGALAFVLTPLFFGVGERDVDPGRRPRSGDPAQVSAPVGLGAGSDGWHGMADEEHRGDLAVAALREIEFDRATGKLSDADYEMLKSRYTADAVAAMRRGDVAAGAPRPADDVEAVIQAYRARLAECPTCGPRPEADAIFCSHCGRYLPGACAACGAAVDVAGAQYCASCGHRLAA